MNAGLRLPLHVSPRWLFLLPFVVYLIPYFWLALGPDELVYATVAQGLLHGELPYRDVFDHKPPLVYVYYAVSFVLFGENASAPRILAAGMLSGTCAVLFTVLRSVFDARRSYVLCAVFALATGAVILVPAANTEVLALLPSVGALALLVTGRDWRYALGAGLCAGLAIWTKPMALPPCLVLGLWLLYERRLLSAVAYAWAVILVSVLVALPWVLADAWPEFYYAVVTYNGLYSREFDGVSWLLRLSGVPFALLGLAPLVLAAVLGLVHRLRSPLDSPTLVLLTWSAGMLTGQFITGRYYEHYIALMLPSLVLCAGFAPLSKGLRLLLAGLTAAAVGASMLAFIGLSAPGYPSLRAVALAHELEATTCSSDLVWEFGGAMVPYFEARRSSPSRFINERAFWLDASTVEEAVRDLTARPPAVIVDSARIEQEYPEHGVTTPLNGTYYPAALTAFLTERYEPPTESHGVLLYRLRDAKCVP